MSIPWPELWHSDCIDSLIIFQERAPGMKLLSYSDWEENWNNYIALYDGVDVDITSKGALV